MYDILTQKFFFVTFLASYLIIMHSSIWSA